MKKWLIAAVIAGLSAGVGCETPESQPGQSAENQPQENTVEASAAESDQAEAKNAEQAEGEQAGPQSADKQSADKQSADKKADKKKAELPEDLADGATGTYGGDFSIEGEPMTLASAMQKASDSQGPYKVSAAVEKVCKKKGCWFTLTAEGVDQPVRVKMKDYGFFVPRNADGAQAVVEGMLEKRVIPQKEAQHYADDEAAGTDKTPDKVEGDKVEWEMIVTTVELSKS